LLRFLAVDTASSSAPRILILESDSKTRATLLRYVVKGWQGASVQSTSSNLEDIVGDVERLKSFDVLLAGCNFATDGTAENPTLRALRAIAADPNNPATILLTKKGSEYSAVQAIKSGAFDYIPQDLLGRERVVSAIQRAMLQRRGTIAKDGSGPAVLRLFGYDIRRCLATRENVSVHVAFSAERGKEVVLKVLHRGRGALARDNNFERFVDEFKLLYDLNDSAVAEIYDFRVTSQYCYIAMEYFPLGHLGGRLGQALPPAEALRYTVEIAHALSIIHAAGIVHRDLKPANIMLRDTSTVALIDFGISRSDAVNRSGERDGEAIVGTPYYMSPEQASGAATDERTDLYALGVILYHMLTGEKPYVGDSTHAILEQHREAPLPRLPKYLSGLQPLLDRLLVKDAQQRLANARELIEAIDKMSHATQQIQRLEVAVSSG
jgi:eukaryotic-like serine/threonine-protein kinase